VRPSQRSFHPVLLSSNNTFFITKTLLLELVSLDWKGNGDGDDGRWTLDDGRWTMDDGRMDDGWVDYF